MRAGGGGGGWGGGWRGGGVGRGGIAAGSLYCSHGAKPKHHYNINKKI